MAPMGATGLLNELLAEAADREVELEAEKAAEEAVVQKVIEEKAAKLAAEEELEDELSRQVKDLNSEMDACLENLGQWREQRRREDEALRKELEEQHSCRGAPDLAVVGRAIDAPDSGDEDERRADEMLAAREPPRHSSVPADTPKVSETAQLSANADEARIQALREELEKLRQRSLLVEEQEPFDGDLTLPDVSYIDNWCNEVDSVLGDPVTGGATSVQLKVYSGTNCPVTNQQASITSLVKGNAIDQASERDLWLAFRYIGAIVCTALLRLLMVLTRWQATEAQFHIENLIDELSPVRWSRLVLAAWDFRLTEDKDRALWQSSLANQLRARLEEEAKLTQEDTRTRVQIYLLTLRRICGGFLNVCFILASWAAIAYATVYKSDISTYLQESTEFKFLGSLAATVGNLVPNLVVAACGMMLPQATKTLTLLEGWSTATRARHLIYRLYLGKVLNATVFVALNVELVYGKPLFSDRLLITRDCQVFRCAEDQAAYTMSSLVLSEFAITILATPLSNVAVGYATHILSGAMKKQAPFVLPDFEIADFAVDIMYFQGLLWTVMLLSPGMAFITPLILFGHFYWLKFTLYRLTSRPFVAETTALSVTLQRCLCLSALLNAAVAVLVLITTVPHETGCGPFDAYQPPGMMLMEINFWGRDTLATIGTWIASNWGLLLVLVTAVTGLLAMRVGISVRTNRNVLEQMSHNSHRHVDALHKEMWRLSRQGELYKKRLEWLEQGRD